MISAGFSACWEWKRKGSAVDAGCVAMETSDKLHEGRGPQRKWLPAGMMLLAAVLPGLSSCEKPTAHPEEAAVRQFLEHYFATWSARDMDAYAACFHPSARIVLIAPGGTVRSDGLTDFLHGQRLAHAQAGTPMTETPTEMKIISDNRSAQASVRWKLFKGSEVVTGTDCFTLIKTDSGWKIVSLVFYND